MFKYVVLRCVSTTLFGITTCFTTSLEQLELENIFKLKCQRCKKKQKQFWNVNNTSTKRGLELGTDDVNMVFNYHDHNCRGGGLTR